jgi:hypothetical protein
MIHTVAGRLTAALVLYAGWVTCNPGADSLLTWYFNGPPRPETLLPRQADQDPMRKIRKRHLGGRKHDRRR